MKQKFTLSRLKNQLLLYSPILVGLIVMWPRLRSPNFGMLDDGIILLVAQRVWDNWLVAFSFSHELEQFFLESQGGRFLPVFWLHHALIYRIIGPDPFRAFFVQSILFLTITGGLIRLVRFRGGDYFQAWATGLFFALSGPIIENFYTLGKTEPPQMLWLGVSLIIIMIYPQATRRWHKIVIISICATALLLAMMIKETTIVLIPISLGWVAVGGIKQHGKSSRNLPTRWAYLIANLLPVGLFFGLRTYFVPVSLAEGSNTSAYRLTWETMVNTISHEISWLMRDYAFLIPLVIFIGAIIVVRKQVQNRLILDAMIWMIGWMVIYLPWQLSLEYYLLPFTAGAAILAGIGLGQILIYLKSPSRQSLRILATICVTLFIIAWPITIINNLTNIHFQIAIDEANAEFLDFTASLPPNSNILLNLGRINEYVIKAEPLLAITRNRPDLSIDYFEFQTATREEPALTYYIAVPILENQTLPTVRIAVTQWTTEQWREAVTNYVQPQPDLVYETTHNVHLFDLGLHRVFCPFFRTIGLDGLYCFVPRPLIDTRTTSYGWEVYQVTSYSDMIAQPAIFQTDGTWILPDNTVGTVKFGQPGDIPLVGDWDGDGTDGLGLYRSQNRTWYLDNNLDGTTDIQFQIAGMKVNDIPLVGDWDGNGTDRFGYFRPDDMTWHFYNRSTDQDEGLPNIQVGSPTQIPIIGDWDGDGKDTIGLYQPEDGQVQLWNSPTEQILFNVMKNSYPIVGDWSGRGVDSIAVIVEEQWIHYPINCNCTPSNPRPPIESDLSEQGIPLAGHWSINK